MNEKVYEEIGTNYRFFARWRQVAVPGLFVVVGATLSITISAFNDAKELIWLIPLTAAPVGVILWIIDVRTRDMYHSALRAGKKQEGEAGGFYTEVVDRVAVPEGKSAFSKLTQTMALNILFFAVLLASLLWRCGFIVNMPNKANQHGALKASRKKTRATLLTPSYLRRYKIKLSTNY